MYKFTFEDKFKILRCAMNRQVKTLDAIEERMQSASKAYWRDILVYMRCAVENQVQRILVLDHSDNGQNQRGGRRR